MPETLVEDPLHPSGYESRRVHLARLSAHHPVAGIIYGCSRSVLAAGKTAHMLAAGNLAC